MRTVSDCTMFISVHQHLAASMSGTLLHEYTLESCPARTSLIMLLHTLDKKKKKERKRMACSSSKIYWYPCFIEYVWVNSQIKKVFIPVAKSLQIK